jgi:predicted naringenin-chalcone synthase
VSTFEHPFIRFDLSDFSKSIFMTAVIHAISTAVPQYSLTQAEALEIARSRNQPDATQEFWMNMIYSKSGVEGRSSVLLEKPETHPCDSELPNASSATPSQIAFRQSFYKDATESYRSGPTTYERMLQYRQHAPTLAIEASSKAIKNAGLKNDEITHLVTVSCTGFSAPGFDIDLIDQLHLSPQIARTHIGFMGCHGALNAMRVARSISNAEPQSRILVCATELCSLHYQYGFQPDQIIANALFADGAAAMIIAPPLNRTSHLSLGVPSRYRPIELMANGSYLFPNTRDAMSWHIGDHGFLMTLSPQVPELIRSQLSQWMKSWLAKNFLSIEHITHWAIHPGGPKIMDAVIDSLGIDPLTAEDSREVLRLHGNMSSPTSLFVLERLREKGLSGHCVMLGFGPGLVVEAALMKL